mmetsp:Transcript_63901/g.93552  ORF Transcript_63901/g.93552 Transcript_63901/m.93552 type:complete len:181 (-) Transcript_63901:77-619(-)
MKIPLGHALDIPPLLQKFVIEQSEVMTSVAAIVPPDRPSLLAPDASVGFALPARVVSATYTDPSPGQTERRQYDAGGGVGMQYMYPVQYALPSRTQYAFSPSMGPPSMGPMPTRGNYPGEASYYASPPRSIYAHASGTGFGSTDNVIQQEDSTSEEFIPDSLLEFIPDSTLRPKEGSTMS